MKKDKLRILVVDDEASVCEMLKAGLEQHGFITRCETSSADIIKTCIEFHPDLVLLDVYMPGKDGALVASELHGHPTLMHTPVIFLTSLMNREEAEARNAASETLLSKPVSIRKLVATICDRLQPRPKD